MGSKVLRVTAAYDRSLLKELPLAGASEVESALGKAAKIADDQSRQIPVVDRKQILRKAIEIMRSREDKFVTDSAAEGGKPLIDTRIEFQRALQGIEVAIEHISQQTGTEIPMRQNAASANRMAFTIREPLGVCVAISAFNHPINLIVHQVVPAFAVGCPVIIKPASTTPLSCLNVVQALYDAGMPTDWCSALLLSKSDAQQLATDRRVAFFSFIGSGDVGWMLASKLAPGVRYALEHGGVAPVIVEADADLDDALPLLAKGSFYHAGQVCVSVQRLYVHEATIEDFADRLALLANQLVVGDPLDESTEIGPLISSAELDRVATWVDEAREAGATVLCGGKRVNESCYAPTVLLNPPDDATVSKQEIFGPVVCVNSYSDRLEAIKRANSLPYSFQASVFTKNIDVALDTMHRLNAKAVMINDHSAFRVDWMPFGGAKDSGIGVGGIPYSMHEMTQEKLVVFRSKLI